MKKALAETSNEPDVSLDPRERAEVERSLAELRAGRPIHFEPHAGPTQIVFSTEVLEPEALDEAVAQRAGQSVAEPILLITAARARHLGLKGAKGRTAALSARGLSAQEIARLADPTRPALAGALPRLLQDPPYAESILELVKAARLLPAAVILAAQGQSDVPRVDEAAVQRFRDHAASRLTQVAEAKVPLLGADETRIVAFRPSDGGREHLAIIIGEPDRGRPVLTRLHSECFTGDPLRSLRCDCGDQLRGAIELMSREGAGLLLYLAQEGRGIGLVNKLRAYALQDRGADTLDANEELGFDADERVYLPAAEMLRQLEIAQIRLLTNNPLKVEALAACGVNVVARVPHSFAANCHSKAYLKTKAKRFGHLL